MGWKEKGKYGVSTGRTVCSPYADLFSRGSTFSIRRGGITEILIKFTRGTEKFSSSEIVEFLAENDIGDGLGDFAESSKVPFRDTDGSSVHRSSVPYSLKKRKRWRLPELAREKRLKLSDFEERPNVTFAYRRIPKKPNFADCIAVQSTKENKVFIPRKRSYARVQGLIKECNKNETEPEVGYEISYRYPSNEYPECGDNSWRCRCCVCRIYFPNPRKARFMNKGIKSRWHCWDMYCDSVVDLSGKVTNEEPCDCDTFGQTYGESKVKVIDAESFSVLKAFEILGWSR